MQKNLFGKIAGAFGRNNNNSRVKVVAPAS